MANPPGNIPPRKSAGGTRTPTNRGPRRARRGRSQSRFYGLLMGVVLVIVAVVVVVLVTSGGGSTSNANEPAKNFTANGTKVYGNLGPENVPLEVGAPLAAANTGLTGAPIDGIQCNANEQLVYHHHVHIAIFINGQPRSIPLGVGMVPPALVQKLASGDYAEGSQTCLYWIHVHAQDGIVHIESPEARTYLLAQVFGIWQQPLSSTQIGPYTGKVTATVNGTVWDGDPSEIPLDNHDQIVLNLNGPIVAPPPIQWQNTGL
jgi:hypothetical protein